MNTAIIIIIPIMIILIVILLVNNRRDTKQVPTQEEREKQYNKNKDKIILYYTDWCGISRNFMPLWNQFSESIKGTLNIEKINCEQYPNICKIMNVSGYPTIKLHKPDGRTITFNKARSLENLSNFVKSNT